MTNVFVKFPADVERMVLGSESEEATNDILIELAKGVRFVINALLKFIAIFNWTS